MSIRISILLLTVLLLPACNMPGSAVAPPAPSPTQAAVTAIPVTASGVVPSPVGVISTALPAHPSAQPSASALPPAASATLPAPAQLAVSFSVFNVASNDTLSLRKAPGANATLVDKLPYDSWGILLTGREKMVDNSRWVEVAHPKTGWVNAAFLTESVARQSFCNDPRVPALLQQVIQAVQQQDGKQLAMLVDAEHGLYVTYYRTGATAKYTPQQISWLFKSTYKMQWGVQLASGQLVIGTFPAKVLPDLLDVFNAAPQLTCNQVILGGHTYSYEWPSLYRNVNYYSIYKPAPVGQELAWRTWLAGITYVGGQPKLWSLTHLFWEP